MTEDKITSEIERLRRLCLVHRYIYYAMSNNLITDYKYDMLEAKLRALVEAHPVIASQAEMYWCCPTRLPGSSLPGDYPLNIPKLCESLVTYARRTGHVAT